MSADLLLSRCDRVRKTGRDSWIASCPTRKDRSPSMTVREMPDGRVLVHDFGGSSVEEILAAVGLDWDALFPEKPLGHTVKSERRRFHPGDVLRAAAWEITTVRMIAAMMKREGRLSDGSHERLGLAMARIINAEAIANGD